MAARRPCRPRAHVDGPGGDIPRPYSCELGGADRSGDGGPDRCRAPLAPRALQPVRRQRPDRLRPAARSRSRLARWLDAHPGPREHRRGTRLDGGRDRRARARASPNSLRRRCHRSSDAQPLPPRRLGTGRALGVVERWPQLVEAPRRPGRRRRLPRTDGLRCHPVLARAHGRWRSQLEDAERARSALDHPIRHPLCRLCRHLYRGTLPALHHTRRRSQLGQGRAPPCPGRPRASARSRPAPRPALQGASSGSWPPPGSAGPSSNRATAGGTGRRRSARRGCLRSCSWPSLARARGWRSPSPRAR